MQKSLYQNTARFYDKSSELQNYYYDINFYRSFVDNDTEVLEIGCGTGRVTLSLLDKCKHITGIELSDQMLGVLKEKVNQLDKEQQSKIDLLKADMKDFSLNMKFDLIIFPGITFQALTCTDQRNSCLKSVREHLSDRGKVIIDFFIQMQIK